MRVTMRPVILLLISSLFLSTLVACVGLNKSKQNIAVYDFGLSVPDETKPKITLKLSLEELSAADTLNQQNIRYRLNYQNPTRVFVYNDSRWATTPTELLLNKLSKMVSLRQPSMNCGLQLKIEAFDHVFQTKTISDGFIQMSATVVEKKSKKIISSQLMTESVRSLSANAQGGTAAMQQASENALKKAIQWANEIADNNETCK